jgi:hypothetical protein
MRDREFVNRFCAFQLLPLGDYRSDMDDWLAQALRTMNKLDEAGLQDLSEQFRRGLNNNYFVFGDHSFRKHTEDLSRRSVLNASLWDVMSTILSHYPENKVKSLAGDLRKAFYNLMINDAFNASITYGTNDAKKVNYRFKTASQAFLEVLGDYPH